MGEMPALQPLDTFIVHIHGNDNLTYSGRYTDRCHRPYVNHLILLHSRIQ